MRESEALVVDLGPRNPCKHMVEVFLEFLALIDMCEAVIECRRTEAVVGLIMLPELSVEGPHEEFIFEGDKGIRVLLLHDVEQLELLSHSVVNESCVGVNWVVEEVGASKKEILDREEGPVTELIGGGPDSLKAFAGHLRTPDADEAELLGWEGRPKCTHNPRSGGIS